MESIAPVAKDREFPQLKEITNEQLLNQIISKHISTTFPETGYKLNAWKVKRVYYKPGDECRIMFKANIANNGKNGATEQLFFGKLFYLQNAEDVFARQTHQALIQPQYGPAVTYIPRWKMVLWAYPNDPEIAGLQKMFANQNILKLAQEQPENFGMQTAPAGISREMKKYVPGKRCGFVYSMNFATSESHKSQPSHKVFGKVYENEDGENAYRVMTQLWDSDARKKGQLIFPQAYSYDSKNKILWQESLTGQSLAKYAGSLDNLPILANEIGLRLAALHNTPIDLPRMMSIDFLLTELEKAVTAVRQNFHDHAKACLAIQEKLNAAVDQLEDGYETTIHASFKFSHIFESEKGIAFIDFDGANLGDPGYDIGRFIAHLYRMMINDKIAPQLANRSIENFCYSYNQIANRPMSRERINWFVASHLVSSEIYKTVKRVDPFHLKKLLRLANRLCPSSKNKSTNRKKLMESTHTQ